ncbi:hypothetical protein ASE85_04270 [Sphingobium sp. Leaf26]|nr:hypothetical protein ASE85_04270 [Sphingobium sp. Leaf26]
MKRICLLFIQIQLLYNRLRLAILCYIVFRTSAGIWLTPRFAGATVSLSFLLISDPIFGFLSLWLIGIFDRRRATPCTSVIAPQSLCADQHLNC